jgi:hypothetical protein
MCGIGSEARGFLHNKGAVVSEALVPFGPARPFQGGCDPLEALSETTNGDADSVVMTPAGQLPKFFTLSLPRILPMKRAVWRAPVPRADSSSSQGSFQTLLTARTIWIRVRDSSAPREP